MTKKTGRRHTRRAIMDTAQRLFQERGFQAFSYHHIAEELGIRNAAVHYYFPTKTDLGVALIQRFREDFQWWRSQLAGKRLSAIRQLEQFVRIEETYLQAGRVCALSVVSVESPGLPQAIREEAGALLREITDWVTAVLDFGLDTGELQFRGSAVGRARFMICALQGALQLGRFADPEIFRETAAMLLRDLPAQAAAKRGDYSAVA